MIFRGPSERSLGSLVGQAIIGDGASSAIIGSDPREAAELTTFQIAITDERILPDSDDCIAAQLLDVRLMFQLS